MKDVTDIFIIKDGFLEINKDEIRTESSFRTILQRDKGSPGDVDGRKKHHAFKEFMYIHLYNHPSSIYRDFNDKERHTKAKEHSGLSDNWKVDDYIKKASKKYLEIINMSSLYHSYINASKAIYAMGEDIKFYNNLRDKKRQLIIDAEKQLEVLELDEERQPLEAAIDANSFKLMELSSKIGKLTSELPTYYDTLKELKTKLAEEAEQGTSVRGGGELGNRETI